MKTIKQHNHESQNSMNPFNVPNGIECPMCKNEMVDVDTRISLCSFPPQKNIKCLKCGYITIVLS